MLSNLILVFVILANVISILLVYYSFGKSLDKNKKFMDTMITIGLVYIIVLIVYDLSTIGIGKNGGATMAKTLMTTAFVPVDIILFAPYMIYSYMKTKKGDLAMEKLNKRAIIMGILAIVVLISEFFYFRNFQNTVKVMQEQLKANTEAAQENSIQEQNTNQTDNTVDNNTIANEETNVETNVETNSVSNTEDSKVKENEVSNQENTVGYYPDPSYKEAR